MSDVKRWIAWVPMLDGCSFVVLASDYDAVVKERDEARATKDLHKERAEKAEAERDDARSYAAEIAQGVSHYTHDESNPCIRCERDKFAATVERIKPWIEEAETYTPILSHIVLDTGLRASLEELFRAYRALAEPVATQGSSPFYYCHLKPLVGQTVRGCNGTAGPHGFGKCVERREGQRRQGHEHTYLVARSTYNREHVRYCLVGASGPDHRRKDRRGGK